MKSSNKIPKNKQRTKHLAISSTKTETKTSSSQNKNNRNLLKT